MLNGMEYWNDLAGQAIRDKDALVELYEHFFPRIYQHLLCRTQNADKTDEVVSRTFLQMYQKLEQFNPAKGAFSTWLFAIAENELRMQWRSEKNHPWEELDETFGFQEPEEHTPEQRLLTKEQHQELQKALAALPERERRILGMRYWLGLSHRKIAETLGLTENHVGVLLNRAKKSLKQYLQDMHKISP